MKKTIFTLLIVSLLAMSGCTNKPGEYDTFANCLTEEGLIMYGTSWCKYCNLQKEDFGNSFDNVNFVDCDKDKSRCNLAKIEAYPTWTYRQEKFNGKQSLEKLSEISGCELIKDYEEE